MFWLSPVTCLIDLDHFREYPATLPLTCRSFLTRKTISLWRVIRPKMTHHTNRSSHTPSFYTAIDSFVIFAARNPESNDLPVRDPIGITIQDGPFPSFLPLGFSKNRCLFAHVEASQLIRNVSKTQERLLSRVLCVESNWHDIRDVSAKYVPLLTKSNFE